jgi:serine/threonine/tyrosine-interacting protein
MQHLPQPRPLARGVKNAAPYVSRPPSPPYIHVPSITSEGLSSISLSPSFDNIDSSQLSPADLRIITRNEIQFAQDSAVAWRYESRRQAQRVLDFIWLGPSSVLRDVDFLRREEFTLLLGVRHSRLAQGNFMRRAEETAEKLGIRSEFIDLDSNSNLVRAAEDTVRVINGHMLEVYQRQGMPLPQGLEKKDVDAATATENGHIDGANGNIIVNDETFKRGRVLVYCETGNDRSAAIVAAYIMAVFGVDLVRALQFVCLQRFCSNFEDDTKYGLQSFEAILNARRTVQRSGHSSSDTPLQGSPSGVSRQGKLGQNDTPSPNPLQPFAIQRAKGKRGIEDTMDVDDVRQADGGQQALASSSDLDMDRYVDRHFVPFVENGRSQPSPTHLPISWNDDMEAE